MSQLSLSNTVPIEVLYDEKNQPRFMGTQMGYYLEIKYIHTSLENLGKCKMRTRNEFEPTCHTMTCRLEPKDHQNKTDIFLSVYGVMHVIVESQKLKEKELREWVLSEVFPRGFNKMIKDKQQAIEEKGSALALLSENLSEV